MKHSGKQCIADIHRRLRLIEVFPHRAEGIGNDQRHQDQREWHDRFKGFEDARGHQRFNQFPCGRRGIQPPGAPKALQLRFQDPCNDKPGNDGQDHRYNGGYDGFHLESSAGRVSFGYNVDVCEILQKRKEVETRIIYL